MIDDSILEFVDRERYEMDSIKEGWRGMRFSSNMDFYIYLNEDLNITDTFYQKGMIAIKFYNGELEFLLPFKPYLKQIIRNKKVEKLGV